MVKYAIQTQNVPQIPVSTTHVKLVPQLNHNIVMVFPVLLTNHVCQVHALMASVLTVQTQLSMPSVQELVAPCSTNVALKLVLTVLVLLVQSSFKVPTVPSIHAVVIQIVLQIHV